MSNERTPDYRYETSPEDLQKAIDTIGLETLLTFCQNNRVEIVQGADYNYGAIINGGPGTWGCELDAFSALVRGVGQYMEHKESPNGER